MVDGQFGGPKIGGFGGTGHNSEAGDKTPQGNAHDQQVVTEKLRADATPKETNNGQGKPTGGPAEKPNKIVAQLFSPAWRKSQTDANPA